MRKKKSTCVLLTVLLIVLAVAGTFAWSSISQTAKNVNLLEGSRGGRIHDDFDGEEHKAVYAENYMKEGEGDALFVRIRLDEYMETGADAGEPVTYDDGGNENPRDVTPVVAGTKYSDKTTWTTHIPGATVAESSDAASVMHDKWSWTLGGKTVYMPTFNKNQDSKEVERNGTWDGTGSGTPYDDYHEYSAGDTSGNQDAYYDADEDDIDEWLSDTSKNPGAGGVAGTNYTAVEENHTAKETLDSTVMTMQEWIDGGYQIGNYWVWDSDGWAYWASPLKAGTATGTLLNGIRQEVYLGENTYYAINVVGEFVTFDDLGTEGTGTNKSGGTGFYADGMTEAAEALFEVVNIEANGGLVPEAAGGATTVDPGQTLQLSVAGVDASDLTWTLTRNSRSVSATELSDAGVLSVASDEEAGTTLTVSVKHNTYPYLTSVATTFTVAGPDSVAITVPDGTEENENVYVVRQGRTLQLGASVTSGGFAYADGQVEWSVEAASGTKQNGTAISTGGLLTVSDNEPVNTVLVVTATSVNDSSKAATMKIKVMLGHIASLITADNKVTLDGVEFYVMEQDTENNRALIWSVEPVGVAQFSDDVANNYWAEGIGMKTYLESWLSGTTDLKELAQETAIVTRTTSDYDTTESNNTYNSVNSKVFLPTEADLFNTASAISITASNSKEYTYGGQLTTDTSILGFTDTSGGEYGWLRSPRNLMEGGAGTALLKSDGTRSGHISTHIGVVRPMLWVDL